MTAATYLYLISLISNFRECFYYLITLLCAAIVISGATILIFHIDEIKDKSKPVFWLKSSIIYFFIASFISCFLPSEKTMYLMIGANYLEKSGIPTKVEQVINKKLNEYLLEEVKK